MDDLTTLLLLLAAVMAAVTWHAHRLGNERRDIALLAVVAGLLGAGSALAAFA